MNVSRPLQRNPFYRAARAAAAWLVRTQASDDGDANCGRFVSACDLRTGRTYATPGWQGGFGAMMLARFWQLERDPNHLAAALRAAEYLKSLQMLHDPRPRRRGAFREETPQSRWCHPRDALSCAWGFLALHDVTGGAEWLERAEAFARWHLGVAFRGRWPAATINFEAGGRTDDFQELQCQSGSGAFYAALFRATGDRAYLTRGLRRIADFYAGRFFRPDGGIRIFLDPRRMRCLAREWEGGDVHTWAQMHMFNDDFGGLCLLEAHNAFGRDVYLERVCRYADWIVAQQRRHGGFGVPHEIEVASATVPLLLMDLVRFRDKPAWRECIRRSLARLLDHQILEGPHRGAFHGLTYQCHPGRGRWMNFRCTIYAIAALLKASGVPFWPFLEVRPGRGGGGG